MLMKETMRARRFAAAAFAAMALSLAGCSTPSEAPDPPADAFGNVSEAPRGSAMLTQADAVGLVVDVDGSGFTLRPDQGDAEAAIIALEETGEERYLEYAAGCAFVIAQGDVATGEVTEVPATAEVVKKDASAYVFLDTDGLVSKVAIFRTE